MLEGGVGGDNIWKPLESSLKPSSISRCKVAGKHRQRKSYLGCNEWPFHEAANMHFYARA